MPISKEKAEKEQEKEREASPEEGKEPESRVTQRQEAGISGRCVLWCHNTARKFTGMNSEQRLLESIGRMIVLIFENVLLGEGRAIKPIKCWWLSG